MRRVVLAVGVLCAVGLTGRGPAQNSTTSTTSTSSGNAMPGVVVGGYRGQVNPVGQKAPAAAPQAGLPITANAMQRPYDPNHPFDAFKGTGIDPKDVLAPLVGPDGKPITEPDALDRLSEKIKALWGRAAPAPPRPAYAPGIIRRGHQMAEHHAWRRD